MGTIWWRRAGVLRGLGRLILIVIAGTVLRRRREHMEECCEWDMTCWDPVEGELEGPTDDRDFIPIDCSSTASYGLDDT